MFKSVHCSTSDSLVSAVVGSEEQLGVGFSQLKCRRVCASVGFSLLPPPQAADFLGGGGGRESKGKSLKITINILSCLNGKKRLRALSESSSVSAKGSQCL